MVPTTWNAGPRDPQGQRGAYEAALLNTPVADPDRPLEILRTIHSFDPCIACAVHVIDANGREYTIPSTAGVLANVGEAAMTPAIRLRSIWSDGNMGGNTRACGWGRPSPSTSGNIRLRLVHWGMVISIGVLSFTGYYIHNPFIIGQLKYPFLMGWFRFVHEAFGMVFMALFLMRIYLFFAGNRWVRWRVMVPLKASQWKEMFEVMKFYVFMRPDACLEDRPQRHGGVFLYRHLCDGAGGDRHRTGDVQLAAAYRVVGPIGGLDSPLDEHPEPPADPFRLMYVFIAFGIFHVHLCLLVSAAEKRGLMDSIFIGYKIIPVEELDEDDRTAIEATQGKRVRH